MTNLKEINRQHKLMGKTLITITDDMDTFVGYIVDVSKDSVRISSGKSRKVYPLTFYEDEIKSFNFLN